MRARHRHFNPRDAGAGLVLDARFIRQSNATSVSSWQDRGTGGNDAAQANATNQPVFQRNAINGQPAVRFDGSDDELESAYIISGTTSRTIIVTYKQTKNDNRQCAFGIQPATTQAVLYTHFSPTSEIAVRTNGSNVVFNNSVAPNENAIVTTSLNGTNLNGVSIRKNGNNLSVSSSSGPSQTLNTTGSSWLGVYFPNSISEQFFGGDVGSVSASAQDLSAPLRRRLEHAAAFSFKISCN